MFPHLTASTKNVTGVQQHYQGWEGYGHKWESAEGNRIKEFFICISFPFSRYNKQEHSLREGSKKTQPINQTQQKTHQQHMANTLINLGR